MCQNLCIEKVLGLGECRSRHDVPTRSHVFNGLSVTFAADSSCTRSTVIGMKAAMAFLELIAGIAPHLQGTKSPVFTNLYSKVLATKRARVPPQTSSASSSDTSRCSGGICLRERSSPVLTHPCVVEVRAILGRSPACRPSWICSIESDTLQVYRRYTEGNACTHEDNWGRQTSEDKTSAYHAQRIRPKTPGGLRLAGGFLVDAAPCFATTCCYHPRRRPLTWRKGAFTHRCKWPLPPFILQAALPFGEHQRTLTSPKGCTSLLPRTQPSCMLAFCSCGIRWTYPARHRLRWLLESIIRHGLRTDSTEPRRPCASTVS